MQTGAIGQSMHVKAHGIAELECEQPGERNGHGALATLRVEFQGLMVGEEILQTPRRFTAVGEGEQARLAVGGRGSLVLVVRRRRPDEHLCVARVRLAHCTRYLRRAVGAAHASTASKSSTTRPTTRPAFRSSSAALASSAGRVSTGSGFSLFFFASATTSFSSCR